MTETDCCSVLSLQANKVKYKSWNNFKKNFLAFWIFILFLTFPCEACPRPCPTDISADCLQAIETLISLYFENVFCLSFEAYWRINFWKNIYQSFDHSWSELKCLTSKVLNKCNALLLGDLWGVKSEKTLPTPFNFIFEIVKMGLIEAVHPDIRLVKAPQGKIISRILFFCRRQITNHEINARGIWKFSIIPNNSYLKFFLILLVQ